MRRPVPLLLLALAACAGRPAPQSAPATAAPSLAVHWVRDAAEYRALTTAVYHSAAAAVERAAAGLERGRWGVILDADETVLDNSEYQRRREAEGQRFSDTTWTLWAREEAATAVPGAVGFIQRVHDLGGLVAIVTNRAGKICPATVVNLEKIGVRADAVLCQTAGSDKNPRFEQVRNGTAAAGVPPLEVVAWVGDNIQDFPGLTQAVRDDPAALAPFGTRFFVLPNPMYGSWERNPPR